jgi:hypothetical protein
MRPLYIETDEEENWLKSYVKPSKPISEMSDEEIDEFANQVWLSLFKDKDGDDK